MNLEQIVVLLILLAVVVYFLKNNKSPFEIVDDNIELNNVISVNSETESNNQITENFANVDDSFVYATKPQPQISNQNIPPVFGASSPDGVLPDNMTSFSDVQTDADVDVFTKIVDNQQLRQTFERSFMLDPVGSVAQNDITQGKFSPSCCPAQWSPSFMDTSKPLSPEFVPNNYSGDSVNGSGCACITKDQANYIRTRGGNGN
jgi:hypothetical protein